MLKKILAKIPALLFICMILSSILFVPTSIHASSDKIKLVDKANLYSDKEVGILKKNMNELSKRQKVYVTILTVDSVPNQQTMEEYSRDYQKKISGTTDSIILAISMEPGNRKVVVHGFGRCKDTVYAKRAQYITDHMTDDLKAKNYYEATNYFLEKSEYFITHEGHTIPTTSMVLCCGIGSIVVAAIIVFILVHNSGGKDTTTCSTYMDTAHSQILGRQDQYINTTVSRVYDPPNDNNSSDGGGGGGSDCSTGSSDF